MMFFLAPAGFARPMRALTYAAALFLLLTLTLIGCDDEQFSESGGAILVVDPSSLVFNAIVVGDIERKQVLVRNDGTSTLSLPFSNYDLSPANADFVFGKMTVDGEGVESLPPQGEAILEIAYVPSGTGAASEAVLELKSSNGGSETITLKTVEPIPWLQAMPSPIVFTPGFNGDVQQQEVIVENTGNALLTITDSMIRDGNSTDFTISRDLVLPLDLDPGEQVQMEVTFTPTGDPRTSDQSELVFISNHRDAVDTESIVEIYTGEDFPAIEVLPSAVYFGIVGLNVTEERQLLVTNVGSATLDISSIYTSIDSSDDFGYADETAFSLEAGETKTLTVTYTPTDAGEDRGFLVIESNDPFFPYAQIGLDGKLSEGVLTIDPIEVDFGSLLVNTTRDLSFTLRNDGDIDLGVSALVPADFPAGTILTYAVENGDTVPFLLAPGEEKDVIVTYAPMAEAPRATSSIEVQSSALSSANQTVNIHYASAASGCAAGYIVSPYSINFGTLPRGQQSIQAFDITNCSLGDIRILDISKESSSIFFPAPNEFSLASGFNLPLTLGSGQTHTVEVEFAPRQAGVYSAKYVVKTDFTAAANRDVSVRGVGAAPDIVDQAIHIRMDWSTGGSSDVDMHLMELSGTQCNSDCYFSNPSDDWGVQGDIADDPFLDLDDVDGYGPENINIEAGVNGQTYRFATHYYTDGGEGNTTVFVKLYSFGVLQQEWTGQLGGSNDVWDVFELDWGPSPVIRTIDTHRSAGAASVCN